MDPTLGLPAEPEESGEKMEKAPDHHSISSSRVQLQPEEIIFTKTISTTLNEEILVQMTALMKELGSGFYL